MTDFSPRPDDEIVSAHLDGEATPEEAAQVEGHAGARDRLAAFEAVRAEVARPIRPDPLARDAAIAAALDVFDREVRPEVNTRSTDRAAATVTDLASRRARRGLQLLSAAAAIVLVVGVLATTRLVDRTPDTATLAGAPTASPTTSFGEVSSQAASGEAPEAEQRTSQGATPTNDAVSGPAVPTPSTAPAPPVTGRSGSDVLTTTTGEQVALVDLGAVEDREQLVHAIATTMTVSGASRKEGAPTTTGGLPSSDPAAVVQLQACDAMLRGSDFEVAALTLGATVTYAGTPAFALLYAIDQQRYPAANGPARLYVVTRTCTVLDVETL